MKSQDLRLTQDLIEEVIRTFRQLRVVSAEIHGGGLPIPGQRGVLMQLSREMQTVPAMARERGVSRQNIQKMIDGFLARGLVVQVDNDAHRRSKFVRLTSKGKTAVNRMIAGEKLAFQRLKLPVSAAQLKKTISALQTLRKQLNNNWPASIKGKIG
jgi:DNA-binding MarR family transcriptional regulator